MRVENRKQSLFMARKKFLILLVCLGMILTSCGGAGSGNVRTDSVNANGVSPTYSVSSKKNVLMKCRILRRRTAG